MPEISAGSGMVVAGAGAEEGDAGLLLCIPTLGLLMLWVEGSFLMGAVPCVVGCLAASLGLYTLCAIVSPPLF